MRRLVVFILFFALPFTLLSEWTLEISGKDIDLSSLSLPEGYSVTSGKIEFKGKISPYYKKFHYTVTGKVKNISVKCNILSGIVSFPLLYFSANDENWELKEGKGKWNGMDFRLNGKGKIDPFTYRLNVFLPSFSMEKLKKIAPLKLPYYLSSVKGDFKITLSGSKEKSVGKVQVLVLNGNQFKNLNAKFLWGKNKIEISSLSIRFKKGEIEGEGTLILHFPEKVK